MKQKKLKLTDDRSCFRPFSYDWAYEAWLQHEQAHWLHTEIPMLEDVKDWKNNISEKEKHFLTQIFRFFTQGDLDVAGGYVNNFLPIFKQPEIRMMLLGFAAREALHVAAYSHLIETLGMPESTYSEFNEYTEMKEKHDYVNSFSNDDENTIAQKIAVFSAFTEGMQLFSSFIMLLNFPRHGKMKGMDFKAINEVSSCINLPLIASSGVGSVEDCVQAVQCGASAVAIGAMFQFTEITPRQVRNFLREQGIQVRISEF